MIQTIYKLKAKVWLYPGVAPWHMVTLPKNQSDKIKQLFGDMHRGWSSLPVMVIIGKTTWKTSIFFDKKAGAYILPLKAEVRKKENISNGQAINFSIELSP
ncbi:MAG: hypothetical protein A3E98_03165 [Candidatus Doudnabacteria bacterium RIFCSPHIGHO2_12_FULL_48_11]|uniref:DUF1905 domain-containing protein n=1 Tax=Candidatus Doudnabacteria bacterium RIFCSPHIGHO2_01_FULL_46_24 TaxID=1817825 RepID=A0A1F5NX11_9BACT|nr:MAG: hypothetical protein A2720_03295 [Candidatus Doudnabacteria bacterium RIFCSPHIGHO2_01_FULL_46_24]OGE96039.1 MAG: hypothetical protein A3E98_03165 [Candidatus Doudnabacteria bacterium RIFCSPHIGHO2_12_FULL_48_11]